MTENEHHWFHELGFQKHPDLPALFITLLGFLARLWTASGTFLNPDEAWHFRLANQTSVALAYKESLTVAHPPLLILLLYYWRALGTSELWLRLPSVLAGTVFCWVFYKWLSKAADRPTGLIGLLLVAFLPPIIQFASEIRQYSLMLSFLASALYFLDEAFAKNSAIRMAAFSLCLYLAMSFHYSAFWFAAALGIYALVRVFTERPPAKLVASWIVGQMGGLALAIFYYESHLSRLSLGQSRTALQGWISEPYLRRSFFDRAHDNPLTFLVGHSFAVFQYLFGQLAVGDVMGVFFAAGIIILLCGKGLPEDRISSRRFGIFLLLPFVIIGAVSLAHLYPYGGTRHIAFLIIPLVAGVSVAIARFGGTWVRGLALAIVVLVACLVFGKPRQPRMERADQSRKNMAAAMQFVKQDISPSDIIFVDYQTDLILGNYLCQQRPISLDVSPANFEQFSCNCYRVVSADYETEWMFWADNFPKHWQAFVQAYNLKPGENVWVFQAGWGIALPEDLRKHYGEFRDLQFQSFGKNIKIFQMIVGRPVPPASP